MSGDFCDGTKLSFSLIEGSRGIQSDFVPYKSLVYVCDLPVREAKTVHGRCGSRASLS